MPICPVEGCIEKGRVTLKKRKLCERHARIFREDPAALDFKADGE